jgi:MSHA biogenesis protein MshN
MSLINKALKDLEQRQGPEGPTSVAVGPYVRATSAPRSHNLVIAAVAAMLGGGAVAGVWIHLQGGRAATSHVAATSTTVLSKQPELVSPAPVIAVPSGEQAGSSPQRDVSPAQQVESIPNHQNVSTSAPALPRPAAPAVAVQSSSDRKPPQQATRAGSETVAVARSAPVVPHVGDTPRAESTQRKPAPIADGPKQDAAGDTATPKPTEQPSAASEVARLGEPKAMQPVAAPRSVVPAQERAPVPSGQQTGSVPGASVSVKTVAPQQVSENLHKQALLLVQQGNGIDARPLLVKALEANPSNGSARLLLATLLLEGSDYAGANAVLREGVRIAPDRRLFMTLARVQVEQSDNSSAVTTLEQGLPLAGDDPDYHAFYAALLQRAGRHEEAVKHYLVALRANPAAPTWLIGAGISLQALGKNNDALEAFLRAKSVGQLSPSLSAFVDQRVEGLKR